MLRQSFVSLRGSAFSASLRYLFLTCSTTGARQKIPPCYLFPVSLFSKNFCTVFRNHAHPLQLTRPTLPRTMRSQSFTRSKNFRGVGRAQLTNREAGHPQESGWLAVAANLSST